MLGVLLFHWRGIQPGQVFLPVDLANRLLPWRDGDTAARLQNWLISDPLYQFYPFLVQTVASLRQGQFLLWNPALFSGHPALADPLFQTFYPFVTAFGLLLGPPRGFSLSLVAHVLLAALLMFGFLRSQRLGLPAAVLGALTYSPQRLPGHLVRIPLLAHHPGLAARHPVGLARRRRTQPMALCRTSPGCCLAWPCWPDSTSSYSSLSCSGQRTLRPVPSPSAEVGRNATFPLGSLLLALVIGALIGAVQVLPFADLLAASRRAAAGAPDVLPRPQLITLLLPHFFGSPALPEDYWGYGNYNEYTIYVGIVTLFLAWLALFARPRYWTSFLLVAVLVVIWFAIGGLGAAWIGSLPVIQQVAPHRAVFLLPLLLGWLAAMMLDDPELGWRGVLLGLAALLLAAAAAIFLAWNSKNSSRDCTPTAECGPSAWPCCWLPAALLAWRAVRPERRPLCDWLIVALVFANLFWYGHDL